MAALQMFGVMGLNKQPLPQLAFKWKHKEVAWEALSKAQPQLKHHAK